MAIAVRADKYFNNQAKFDNSFMDVEPVDLNAALVHPKVDKWGMDEACGEQTENNIRERFDLVTPDDGDE